MKIISNDFYYALLRSYYTQPTLYGYNIEHLALIANVLQIEDFPPEKVVEALTYIGRIISIVREEFERGTDEH